MDNMLKQEYGGWGVGVCIDKKWKCSKNMLWQLAQLFEFRGDSLSRHSLVECACNIFKAQNLKENANFR